MGCAAAHAGTEDSTMLRIAQLLPCDGCDAIATRFERGWRAYVVIDVANAERRVTVVCPCCAERIFGDDETT